MKRSLNARRLSVVILDIFVILGAYYFAFLLRFDFSLDSVYWGQMLQTMPIVLVVFFATGYAFSLYHGLYYFSSLSDLVNVGKSVASAALISGMAILFLRQGVFPRSILLLHPIISFLSIGGVRFGIRLAKSFFETTNYSGGKELRVIIIGAGNLGENLLRQMRRVPGSYKVVGFIDDDENKWGMNLQGCEVFGGRDKLAEALNSHHPIDEIILAIDARRGEILRSIMDVLRDRPSKPEIKIAPNLDEVLRSPGDAVSLRKVRPMDLLNRKPVELNLAQIGGALRGKTVLVTGAGGTIGAELCRQVLRFEPAKLIIFECHGTSLFYIEEELRQKNNGVEIAAVLGDIRDEALVEQVMSRHRPNVVLHAAAHKHVHQLETNVAEGVGNNIIGTRNLARAADKNGAEAFLLISTDKAVHPSSVMGATKRVAEYIVRDLAERSRTRFMAVRFGNVLGSSGSVLEIFQRQLAAGGPLTVTDAAATRFFMTVEEAVALILQTLGMASGGEIFVLQMGTAVRIIEMAKNLIILSGLEPGKDIEIRVTGLKPGEKLNEELMESPERFDASTHPDILTRPKSSIQVENFDERLRELTEIYGSAKPALIIEKLQGLVATFKPDISHSQDTTAAQRR